MRCRRCPVIATALFLAFGCTKSSLKHGADAAGASTGGTSDSGTGTDAPSGSGGVPATGGASSGGVTITGGAPSSDGASNTGGTYGTGGSQSSIDASRSDDGDVDGETLPECVQLEEYGVSVCTAEPGSGSRTALTYSGTVIAAGPADASIDARASLCGTASFTLALQDGGTITIGYGASGETSLPSLAAWVGRSVSAEVLQSFRTGYAAGAHLVVTDSAGLVLAVEYGFGMSVSSTPVETSGVAVSPGAGICVGGCRHLKREVVFSGSSTVSLAPGASGSFELGGLSFTALALSWSERQATSGCADAYPYHAWAIWRQAP
jgi:hypothetical protein